MARGALKMRRIEYSVRLRGASIILCVLLRTSAIAALKIALERRDRRGTQRVAEKTSVFRGGLEGQNRRRVAVVPHFSSRCVAVIVGWRRFRFVNISEPLAGRRALTFRNFEENLLNLLSNRSTSTLPHRDPVDGTNRRDFSSRTREEQLVSYIQRRALNCALFHSNAEFLADLNHAVPRDAGKNGR